MLVLISLLAGGLIAYATQHGPWGFSDPVAYIVSGRNLVRGIGIGYHFPDGTFHWLAFHPPFFPIVSSLFTRSGIDEIHGIRFLVIGLFAVSVFVAGFSIYRYTASPELSIPASLFMAIFPPMVRMYSSAMSEPLFLTLWFISAISFLAYLRQGARRLFWLAAVTASLTILTRYIGAALVAASALTLLLIDRGNWLSRLKKAVGFGLIASVPTAAWMIWIYFQSSRSLGGRATSLDPTVLLAKFQQFRGAVMDTLMAFVPIPFHLSYRLRWILLGGVALGIILVTWWAARRLRRKGMTDRERSSQEGFLLHGLGAVMCLVFMGLTYLPTQPPPDIDERTLLPFFPPLALGLISAFSLWSRAWFSGWKRWLNLLPWLGTALFLLVSWPRTLNRVTSYHEGVGLTADYWRASATIEAVKDLPQNIPLISNEAPAILLWADRPAYDLDETIRQEFITQAGAYGSDSQDRSQKAFQAGGALIIFPTLSFQLSQAYGDAGAQRLDSMLRGLYRYGEYQDGAIYFLKPPASP